MTVVLAIERYGEVVMAADTMSNYDGDPLYGAVKIRRLGDVLFSVAGNGALMPAMQAHDWGDLLTVVPGADELQDVWQKWADNVALEATDAAEDRKLVGILDQSSPELDGSFLVAAGGHLAHIFTGQALVLPRVPRVPDEPVVAAIGSGGQAARGYVAGALAGNPDINLAKLAIEAVAHACRTAQGCGYSSASPILLHRL